MKAENSKETVTCECCGKQTPPSEARMDQEDANWFCEKCIKEASDEYINPKSNNT